MSASDDLKPIVPNTSTDDAPPPPPPDTAEALATAVPAIPRHVAVNLRRGLIVAVPLGGLALLGLSLVGHPIAGVLVFLGLALGALNTYMTQRSVVQYAKDGQLVAKKRFILSSLMRLGIITVIGVGPLLVFRPDGLGVIGGLAVFQVIMLIVASMPLIKEFRRA
jgi:hypothetical protein